jgi:hypothetical protein
MHARAWGGFLLLAAASLSATWRLADAVRAHAPEVRWAERVDHYDRARYAGLGDALPAHGVFGYLDDGGCDNAVQGYYLTQYALAPRLLVEDASPPLLLVDGRPDQPPALPEGLTLVRDLGNGVRVYRRGAP